MEKSYKREITFVKIFTHKISIKKSLKREVIFGNVVTYKKRAKFLKMETLFM